MLTQEERHHRRSERRAERTISRVRWMTAPLALAGVITAGVQLVKSPPDRPVPALVVLGLICVVPWLATWTYRL